MWCPDDREKVRKKERICRCERRFGGSGEILGKEEGAKSSEIIFEFGVVYKPVLYKKEGGRGDTLRIFVM